MKVVCDADTVCLEVSEQDAEDLHAACAFLAMEIQDSNLRLRLLELARQLGAASIRSYTNSEGPTKVDR